MSRRKPGRVTIDWDALTDATAKAIREAHWGSIPQYEDTIKCPKCGGEVLVTGWQNTGVAHCMEARRFGGMLDTRPWEVPRQPTALVHFPAKVTP